MLSFLDDFSRYSWVYFIKTKDEVFIKYEHFLTNVVSKFGGKLQTLRTDNGTEFKNTRMQSLSSKFGVIQQFTAIYTP